MHLACLFEETKFSAFVCHFQVRFKMCLGFRFLLGVVRKESEATATGKVVCHAQIQKGHREAKERKAWAGFPAFSPHKKEREMGQQVALATLSTFSRLSVDTASVGTLRVPGQSEELTGWELWAGSIEQFL